MKNIVTMILTITMILGSLLQGEASIIAHANIVRAKEKSNGITLRICNWEEYMDLGGWDEEERILLENGVEIFGENPMYEDFEKWYFEQYGREVHVEYSCFGTNEDLYNQLNMGDAYDLVCPSEYMIMKLMAEDRLMPYSQEFFDKNGKNNYYINSVSPYIRKTLAENEMNGESWAAYAAGYMWGTTGLVYNPEGVSEEDLSQGWKIMLDSNFRKKVTTKDNVRDSYFVGLGIVYRDELLSLDKNADDYNANVTDIFNRTDTETVKKVQDTLLAMKNNIFGFETDTGKSDMVKGTILLNFAWSGDAVYAMDEAENQDVYLNFHIPEEGANLFFDGWVMPKGASKKEAQAFINFMSRPDNAVRNSYYIGYTSVIAGKEMFEYACDVYSAENEEQSIPYDVSYFFGEDAIIYADEEQLSRQLFAQYPPEDTMKRCAVMSYYGTQEERINELWTQVKGEKLDGWAIAVITVAIVVIALAILYWKLGRKIEFRLKPRKGYRLTDQKEIR